MLENGTDIEMSEQELKEYAWEIGERLSHLQTALGRLDYHERLNDTFAEICKLNFPKHDCINVLATMFRDYDIDFEPHLVPAFHDIHCYVNKYLFNELEYDNSGSLKEEIGFGRRPA